MTFLKKIWGALRDIFLVRMRAGAGIDHETHGVIPTIIAWCIVGGFAMFVLAIPLGVARGIFDYVGSTTQNSIAAAAGALNQGSQDGPATQECLLDKGTWSVWDGVVSRNKDGYFLPASSPRGLFTYSEPLDMNGLYTIAFAPSGDLINFSILVPDLYEIVIGDGDYQTVSFKYSDALGSPPNNSVRDSISDSDRPTLTYPIKKGTEVQGRVQESEAAGRITIDLEVIYVPEIGDNPGPWKDHFQFEFTPASLDLRSRELVIGVFRVKQDGAKQIEVQFICPRNP